MTEPNLSFAARAGQGSQSAIETERFRGLVLLSALVLSPLVVGTTNGFLSLAAVWTLALLLLMLFRFDEPPVFAFAALAQWMSVAAPVFAADGRGETVGTSLGLDTMTEAAWLGLASVLVLGAGMHVGRGPHAREVIAEMRAAGRQLNPLRLLLAFAVASAFAYFVVPYMAGVIPTVSQQVQSLGALPTLVAFVTIWSGMLVRSSRPVAIVVVLYNVCIGFLGFFSGFKDILFLTVVVIGTSVTSLRRLLVSPSLWLSVAAATVLLGFWQLTKVDYRGFANGGTRQQVVTVSRDQQLAYLRDRAAEFGPEELAEGLGLVVERIGYLDFFSGVLDNVPARVPHQNGRLWGETVQHVFLPRVLFPGKGAINDSDRTNEYSGMRVSDAAHGASISIGYAGESYIDFGPFWMFPPIFLLGVLWGWGYRLLARTGGAKLLSVAAASTFVLSGALYFESSNIKIVGGAITLLLVLWLVLRFFDEVIWAFLTGGTPNIAAAGSGQRVTVRVAR
ncbi:MAG: hypothetical protein JST65_18790 [Acidobacteria bacterium]|nr:hypothetical protein [Acidobacteriota bacterium]